MMHRNHNAVQAILACGLLGASYGAIVGAVYGGALMVILTFAASHVFGGALMGGFLYGLFFGAFYRFFAGIVGGTLGGPVGWGIGGLLGGFVPGYLLFSPAGGTHLFLITGGVLPGLIGGAIGVTIGRAIAAGSPLHRGIPWLMRIVTDSPLIDWLWWRGDDQGDDSSPGTLRRTPVSPRDDLPHLLQIELPGTAPCEEEDAWSRGDDLLDYLPIASSCQAAWQEMGGDDLVRFCPHCGKNVYDLSGMSRWEAIAFVREAEAQHGARFYRRRDGTLLTDDCPLGRRQACGGGEARFGFAVLGAVLIGWLGNWMVGTWEGEPASIGPVILGGLLGVGLGDRFDRRCEE
jgi:hypothetical protein